MGFATSQQLNKFYDSYKNIDVTFTKDVIQALSLNTQQVYVRCAGSQWPCIINSASMVGAKIIAGKKSGLYAKIEEGHTNLRIRFFFFEPGAKDSLSFFVSAKLIDTTPYGSSADLVIFSLEYTQRAPDDLIEKLGFLLEANISSTKRKEERIQLDPASMRKMNLAKKETIVFIQGIPRRCILRDLSFSGARFIMVGVGSFLSQKGAMLKIDFEEPDVNIGIRGKIVRAEQVEGRKDLVSLAMEFTPGTVPMIYKMHLNQYFSHSRNIPPLESEQQPVQETNQQIQKPQERNPAEPKQAEIPGGLNDLNLPDFTS
ncbi:PilZ domain-containing protein [Treponema phagedenis]|uniref:PilZ domain-containing protein n=1 Tax=Treponema phagedenis TaxID=162 RepID=UPI0001F63AB8|nr:PilZ domain-containing protein [Treponema phagedenis]EFW38829.1 type IV pilus assembly protein PilZ [Treponema phagedenis F0421]TYT78245.1 PilZ domain-containing protein [Treponema phagedenis]